MPCRRAGKTRLACLTVTTRARSPSFLFSRTGVFDRSHILQSSDQCYAQLVAASTLTRLVTRPTHGMAWQERQQLREEVLQTLFTRPLEPFVVSELCKLAARITKLGWFESNGTTHVFRTVLQDSEKFLDAGPDRMAVGFNFLCQLLAEMNQPNTLQGMTQHRKVRA